METWHHSVETMYMYTHVLMLHVETNLVLVCSVCTNKRCNKVPGDAHVGKLTGTMREGTFGKQSFFIKNLTPKDCEMCSSPVVPFVGDCVYNVPQVVMQSEDFHLAW